MPQYLGVLSKQLFKLARCLVDDRIVWDHIDYTLFVFSQSSFQSKFNAAKGFAAAGWHVHKIDLSVFVSLFKNLLLEQLPRLLELGPAHKGIKPLVDFIKTSSEIRSGLVFI